MIYSAVVICHARANLLPFGQTNTPTRTRGCVMELPIVAPAPVVSNHAAVFRDLFDNQCQFRHFQHYLTGLIVRPHKSMAHIARCILDSADKTTCRVRSRRLLAGGRRRSSPHPLHAPADRAPSPAPTRVAYGH